MHTCFILVYVNVSGIVTLLRNQRQILSTEILMGQVAAIRVDWRQNHF